MMDRLTMWRKDGRAAIANNDNASPIEQMSKIPDIINRLAVIEDILGPDYDLDHLQALISRNPLAECKVLKKKLDAAEKTIASLLPSTPREKITTCFGHPIERVLELVEADQKGQIITLKPEDVMSIAAATYAIVNNKKLYGALFVWDPQGKKGGPFSIPFSDAAITLHQIIDPVLKKEVPEE